jgi:homoserine/homoserine lactone efflux protein
VNIESLLLYLLTWLVIALTPGPAVICVMSQTAQWGIQAGLRGILGIQIGNVIFFLCIAFGLVTLLARASNALVVVQIAGAGYLLYLGLRLIISSLQRAPEEATSVRRRGQGSGNVVVQAVLVQLTNPKALMFVSALVPQFLDLERRMMVQMAILLSCTVVIDTLVLGSYVLLADRGTHSLRNTRLAKWIECSLGLALVSLGVSLLDWRK